MSELDSTSKNAAKDVQTVETMLSNLKAQLKEKCEEVKRMSLVFSENVLQVQHFVVRS